jgi:RNA polymerase sigma factor (sigma-70 family)
VPDRAIEPVDTSEDRDELRRMLRGLSQQEREVVVLRYYCDLSEKDAAAALRLPVSTVKTAASRALARLRVEVMQ